MSAQQKPAVVHRGRSRSGARTKLTTFAQRLLLEWRRLSLPTSDSCVLVAVSGGADSTALLLSLEELIRSQIKLRMIVSHLDHGLRKRSAEDAKWVSNLAEQIGAEVISSRANVKRRAKETADNLEQAARRARYEYFENLASQENASLVLTAHTMDDQTETVLLRLMRGSGSDGLAGIEPVRPISTGSPIALVRPLVTWARRTDTESYCRLRKVRFRVDEMNDDEHFARVRVRKKLVPLLESFNGRIVEAIARTAELLRDDASALNASADQLLQEAGRVSEKSETVVPQLNVNVLASAPVAIRRRALRKWIQAGRGDLRRFEMVHLNAVEKLLQGTHGGRIAELPGGAAVVRKRGWLELVLKRVL